MQSFDHLGAQMEPYEASARLDKRLTVTEGLRRLERAKAESRCDLASFGRDGHILQGIGGQLDKQASPRVAFVELSGRVQITRSIAKRSG